jgi:cardiolipin synthase
MAPEVDDSVTDAGLWTAPNMITLVRLLCIPVFVWLLFGLDAPAAAAVLLALLGATDWVDGYVARRFHQVSNVGKAFDPTVDRLLLIVGVGSIIIVGAVPLWLGLVVVIREVLLSAWVVGLLALGGARMDVTFVGKTGTFLMMAAFPAFLAATDPRLPQWAADVLEVIAWGTAIPGLACSIVAFVGYIPRGLQSLRDGRSAAAAAAEGSGP